MDLHRVALLATVVAAFAALGPWATMEERGIEVFEPAEVRTYVVSGASGLGWVVVGAAMLAVVFGIEARGTVRDLGVAVPMLGAAAFVLFQISTDFFFSRSGGVFADVVGVGWGAAGAVLGSAVAVGAIVARRARPDAAPSLVDA